MKKLFILLLLALSATLSAQEYGSGWIHMRAKYDYLDSANFARQFKLAGVAVRSSAAELNILDGALINVSEINRLSGVSSNIQSQLDAKANANNPSFDGVFDVDALRVGGTTKVQIDSITSDGPTIAFVNNGDTLNVVHSSDMLFDAYEWLMKKYISINAQTDSYTLVLTDAAKLVTVTKGTVANVTIPPNSSVVFPIGTYITIAGLGAGQVSLVAGSGVTIISSGSALDIIIGSGVTITQVATDTWWAVGGLE